jgi:hypothetical protein
MLEFGMASAMSEGRAMVLSRLCCLIVATAVLTAVSSCGLTGGRDEAKNLADRYFAASEKGDYESILSLYSPKFLAQTSREDTRTFLVNVHNRCGVPMSHTLQNWRVFSDFSSGSTQVDLLYDVSYSRCRVSERILVLRPSGGKAQILGHHLNVTSESPSKGRDFTTT